MSSREILGLRLSFRQEANDSNVSYRAGMARASSLKNISWTRCATQDIIGKLRTEVQRELIGVLVGKNLSRRSAIGLLATGAGTLLLESSFPLSLNPAVLVFRIESRISRFGDQIGYTGAGIKEIDEILRLNDLYSEFHSTLANFVSDGVLHSFELIVATPSLVTAKFICTNQFRANSFSNSQIIKSVGEVLRNEGLIVSTDEA